MALSLLCTFVAHITFLHVFFLPPLSFSLSLLLSLSLSLSFSLSLFISAPSFSLWLQDTCHLMPFTKYSLSWSILLFHTISFHSSYKIHQLFTDYLLRLPSSELLEKHLFRSRANRRLVPMICGSGGSKSRLAKAAGAEPSGQRRDEKLHAVVARSTFGSQIYKTPHSRSTFGSWDVEKVHAVVARSTFPSQNVKSTRDADHFWHLMSKKCARLWRECGAKHISKSKC